MSAERIDVLSAIRELRELADAISEGRPDEIEQVERADKAIAAAAELIEAAKLARAQMAHKHGCGRVRPTTEWAEHGSWNYEGCCCDIKRVDAAIARIGGAK